MLKISLIRRRGRLFYTREEIARGLGISLDAAKMFIRRRMAEGEILRLRRDLYVLSDDLTNASQEELFHIANAIQTPSYISYATALNYYNLSTQVPVSAIESTNPVRSKSYSVAGLNFRFFYCKPSLYFAFVRKEGFFIAQPEKALLDALLLTYLGKYALDEAALDLKTIHWKTVEKYAKRYSKRFRKYVSHWRDDYERS